MRLSAEDQTLIHHAVALCFGRQAKVFLFGSRTDDTQRGGDIDLYVETALQGMTLQQARLGLMTQLQLKLGDQKIDVVTSDGQTESVPAIVVEARRTGVLL